MKRYKYVVEIDGKKKYGTTRAEDLDHAGGKVFANHPECTSVTVSYQSRFKTFQNDPPTRV